MTKRYVGYARQSLQKRNETRDTSLSLDAQEHEIRAWVAQQDGGELIAMFRDHDESGKNPNRPELLHARAALGPGCTLVVWKYDRLMRDFLEQEKLVQAIERDGYAVVATAEPGGTTIRRMFGVLAEHERQEIGRRIASASRQRHHRGLHHGAPPFGTERDLLGKLIPNADFPAVRAAFDLALQGHGRAVIARRLAAAGFAPPKADGWRGTVIAQMLRNPVYAGGTKLNGEIRWDCHPPMIPREEWQRVQTLRSERNRPTVRDKQTSSWVEGLVDHACGRRMYLRNSQTVKRGKAYPQFTCASTLKDNYVTRCTAGRPNISKPRLEWCVRAALAADAAALVNRQDAVSAVVRSAGTDSRAMVARAHERKKRALERRTMAEELLFSGRRDREWFYAIDDECARVIAEAEAEIASLTAGVDEAALFAHVGAIRAMADLVPRLPENNLRDWLLTLGRAVVGPDGVRIAYRHPFDLLIPYPVTIIPPHGMKIRAGGLSLVLE